MPYVNRMCFRGLVPAAITLSAGCGHGLQPTADQGHTPYAKVLVPPNSGSVPQETAPAVPSWAQGIVWYQVFPERFRNANPANDPYAWDRTILPWDQPFRETTFEEIETHWNRRAVDPTRFTTSPGHWWGAAGQAVFTRRYGGDLQGVVERLDDLAELGVTGLYLCPVFDSRSLHKYDATDYRHVDPTLGDPGSPDPVDRSGEDPLDETTWGWEPADRYLIDVLLPEARARGMRVILDGVWNHVGTDHFAFRDVLQNGADSPYADWFKVEFDSEGRVARYDAWDRPSGQLPEFRQTGEGDLAPGPKAHIMAVTRRWMDPNGDGDPSDGVDGWRLDVAAEVGRAFWRSWRAHVRSINPDALTVAEIWTDAQWWFEDGCFDAQMNYPLAMVIADWLAIGQGTTDAAACAERIMSVIHHAPEHERAQMTLIASHDTERGVSLMANRFARDFDSDAGDRDDGLGYDPHRADAESKRRLMEAYRLLVALPGSPMIYNGDEWALPGADDPDNRRPIHWPGLAPTPDTPDPAFRDELASMLRLRSDPRFGEVLRFGSCVVEPLPGRDAVGVRRALGDRMVETVAVRTGARGPDQGFPPLAEGWRVVTQECGFRLLER